MGHWITGSVSPEGQPDNGFTFVQLALISITVLYIEFVGEHQLSKSMRQSGTIDP